MRALSTRVEWLKAKEGASQPEVTDWSAWDWFAKSCSYGLPPGECRAHPRARPTQRPPAGGAYAAGRGAGKTRAGGFVVSPSSSTFLRVGSGQLVDSQRCAIK